jgi:hypothetical protein
MVRRTTNKRLKSCVILIQVISMAEGRFDIGAINSGGHENRPTVSNYGDQVQSILM